MNEYLRRIDERDYLTEREHREFLDNLSKDLEEKELLESELKLEKDKVKYVMKQLKKQDKILDQLKEILSMDYLVRVYGYEMAKRLQAYLKSNDLLKEWLDGKD